MCLEKRRTRLISSVSLRIAEQHSHLVLLLLVFSIASLQLVFTKTPFDYVYILHTARWENFHLDIWWGNCLLFCLYRLTFIRMCAWFCHLYIAIDFAIDCRNDFRRSWLPPTSISPHPQPPLNFNNHTCWYTWRVSLIKVIPSVAQFSKGPPILVRRHLSVCLFTI